MSKDNSNKSDISDDEQSPTMNSSVPLNEPLPSREIICGDAIAWLNTFEDNGLPEGYSGFTSLPDISEVMQIFHTDTVAYKKWFTDSAALFMSKLAVGSYIIFLQSDVRYLSTTGEVSEWIDKSFLCSVAAERTGCVMMWHKLVSSMVPTLPPQYLLYDKTHLYNLYN